MPHTSSLNTILAGYSHGAISPRSNKYKVAPVQFQPKDLSQENPEHQHNPSHDSSNANNQTPSIRVSTGQKYNNHVASALLVAQEDSSKSEINLNLKRTHKGSKNLVATYDSKTGSEKSKSKIDNAQADMSSYKDVEKKVNDSAGIHDISYVHNAYNNIANSVNTMSYHDYANDYSNFQIKNPVGNTSEYPFPDSPLGERTQSYVAGLYMQAGNYNQNSRSTSSNSHVNRVSKL